MAVLTIDTATHVAAVAVASRDAGAGSGTVLASFSSLVPRGHSRVLQPAIASVLETAKLTAKDLSHIVVGVGPGSYTGVRLGVTTAKAMAAALGIAVVPVSTLLGMAETAVPYAVANGGESATVAGRVYALPLLYARRQRAFGALYEKSGRQWTTVVPEQVLGVQEWAEVLRSRVGGGSIRTVIVHDFEPKHRVLEELPTDDGVQSVHLTDVSGGIGAALFRVFQNQNLPVYTGADVHTLVPDYALPVEAEAKLAERSLNS